MSNWHDPHRRREPDDPWEGGPAWRRDPGAGDELPELIRRSIDEELKGLVFPGAMAQRVIHGSRARRPWGRAHAALLIGVTVVSCAGVVGGAAIVPALLSQGSGAPRHDGPFSAAPSVVVSASAEPAPSRMVDVGYVPRGWRRVPLRGDEVRRIPARLFAGPGEELLWAVRYERLHGTQQVLIIRAALVRDGLGTYGGAEERDGALLKPYRVPMGRALAVAPVKGSRAHEARIYWEPKEGLLVIVQAFRMPSAELRKVISGMRVTA
ncbi:hypothetical protein [Thermomonospora sp. CIF 1]|uniref:hypothetical protein n=1 Tax=Thermomonospora sp. CIF 1 TaxID=1916083 RepID=UPI000A9D8355|nr:hypothetical protein [Thermomonospora sp. CIF 1]PKK14708.1 MAG: hypothetical protein BUE48_008730 [Thermomonospora sp. CIF 1]